MSEKKTSRKNQTAEEQGAPASDVVDARSTDGKSDGRFHKDFVVQARSWRAEDGVHGANKVAVLQEALFRGLHPKDEVHFDGQEEHPDGKSLILSYSVDVEPAAYDEEPAKTRTPRKAIEDLGGSTQDNK